MALQQEFIRRFADFKAMEKQFDLLSLPFACDIETTTEELQIELIDLQSDNSLKKMFETNTLVEFYVSLPSVKFQRLKNFSRKIFVLFASTYIWTNFLNNESKQVKEQKSYYGHKSAVSFEN